MYQKQLVAGLLVLPLIVAAGCGSSGDQAKVDALKQSPEVQKNIKELNHQATVCFKGVRSFSKHGRQAYIKCLVPPAKQAQAKRCFQQDIRVNGVPFTKRKALKEMSWLANCIAIEKATVAK